MTYVLKITKPTYNVLTETDPRNFILNSDYNHLKTAGSGTMKKTIGASSVVSDSIAHGLSVVPMMLGYFYDTSDSNKWYITMSQPVGISLSRPITPLNVCHAIDSSYIYFWFLNNDGSSHEIELYYEFFYEGI